MEDEELDDQIMDFEEDDDVSEPVLLVRAINEQAEAAMMRMLFVGARQ